MAEINIKGTQIITSPNRRKSEVNVELTWRYFYTHILPLLMNIKKEKWNKQNKILKV